VISRCAIVCRGCHEPFVVRLTLAPSKLTRFYLPCPACQLPIRGRSQGEDLDSHKVDFDADWFDGEGEPELVVTVDPHVPSNYESSEMGPFGSAPAMTLVQLAGDGHVEALFMHLSRGRFAAEELWPRVRRIYEYYLESDWKRFDSAGATVFGEQWLSTRAVSDRSIAAHGAIGSVLAQIVDDEHPATGQFLQRYRRKHRAALRVREYRAFVAREIGEKRVALIQRHTFDVVDLFVSRLDSWQMGQLRRLIPEERQRLLAELRLFRDEFDVVRDLYQQGFETACKISRYPVAAQNVIKRRDPNLFGDLIPAGGSRKKNPGNIEGFEKLSNFEKLRYVEAVPGLDGWVGLLDNRTRNAIGHATARHDLRTGLIRTDDQRDDVTYLDLVSDTYGVFDALCACLLLLGEISA
jgi:hypothetical protein